MSIRVQIQRTIDWRVQRSLQNVYGGYCNENSINHFCKDIQYHLWSDIPTYVYLGVYTNIIIDIDHEPQDDPYIHHIKLTVTIDHGVPTTHYVNIPMVPCVESRLKMEDITLNEIHW